MPSETITFIDFFYIYKNDQKNDVINYIFLDPWAWGAFLVRYFPGPHFIKLKIYELVLLLVTFACRLRDYKKLVDFPRMSPSLTCIGRIRAL